MGIQLDLPGVHPEWGAIAQGGRPDIDHMGRLASSGDEVAARSYGRLQESESLVRRIVAILGRCSVHELRDSNGGTIWYPPKGERLSTQEGRYGRWPWYDELTGANWSPVYGDEDGFRHAPEKVEVASYWIEDRSNPNSGRVLQVDSRAVRENWAPDPVAEHEAVCACSRAWLATLRPGSRQYGFAPVACKRRVCPACISREAARRSQSLLPELAELSAAGLPVVHMTLTQEADLTGTLPVLLTDAECRAGFRCPTSSDDWGFAVPGESLLAAHERLYSSFRALRNRDAKAAEAWNRWVGGYVYRWEATGRRKVSGGNGGWHYAPRWHAHLHVLAVLRGRACVHEVRADKCATHKRNEQDTQLRRDGTAVQCAHGQWWDELTEHWCRLSGAKPQGQRATLLEGSQDEIEAALREVLKYQCKPAELTDAQLLEFLAATKGLHAGYKGGWLHGRHRVNRAAAELMGVLRGE